MMEEILVVIPYLASGAQGHELRLAVEGWRQHFKENFILVIVGDRPPFELKDDCSEHFIECPRIDPAGDGQYLPHPDMVHKFLTVYDNFPDSPGFVYTCDDIYAVKDFTFKDIIVPKISCKEVPPIDYRRESDWFRDLGKTRELCARKGWPTMNWVCHLPVFYFWEAFRLMADRFDMEHYSYIMENIVFNRMVWAEKLISGKDIIPEFIPETGGPWKYGVQTSSPDFKTTEETGAMWITNSNSGWSARLEEILARHYGLPDGWER